MSEDGGRRGPGARAALVLSGFTLAGALMAVQAYLSYTFRGEPIAWGRTFAVWLAWAYAWALLTPAALFLAARVPLERPRLGRALAAHAAAGAVLAALNLALFAAAAPFVGSANVTGTWLGTFTRLLGTAFLLNLPVYWVIVAIAQGTRLARAARERERRALRLEAQLAEARLHALQAQLQPHFLFNALNSVAVLMREDVDAAERVLVLLGRLLRRALEVSGAPEVPLREEIAFLETYLEIERTRFADRLSYGVAVAPEVLEARVPSLILQPLVENAIRHGIARRAAPGRVEVAAERRGDTLRLTVSDDGPGLAPGASDGVGLSNTRARLAQLYGADHSFELVSGAGRGLSVSLAIPLRLPAAA